MCTVEHEIVRACVMYVFMCMSVYKHLQFCIMFVIALAVQSVQKITLKSSMIYALYLHLPLCDVKSEVNNCVSFLWLKVCSHHMTFQYLLLSAITISSTDMTALTAELVKSVPLFCL